MNYKSPDAADLANVHALNCEFLRVARGGGNTLLAALPVAISERLKSLSAVALDRLARTPFLLFTIGEADTARWQPLFDGDPALQLLDNLAPATTGERQVATAALAFLWQLVRRQPYTARVISGASREWCEQLAACTLVTPMQALSVREPVVTFRCNESPAFWRKLLLAATSGDQVIRKAARLSALQMLLTTTVVRPQRLPRAACAMQLPARHLRTANKATDRVGVQDSTVSKATARGYNTPPDACTDYRKPE